MTPPEPTLRLTLDTEALAANWRALDVLSGHAAAGAAVKADCYGLGVAACVPVLREAGARHFFVAHWSEVGALAEHVPPEQISVLHGPVRDQDVANAKATRAVPVINSLTQAQRWNAGGGGLCHLMVDTGINRLGVAPEDLCDPLIQSLSIDTLMSHLASADEDTTRNAAQLTKFRECLPLVSHKTASLANSAGIALGADFAFDRTRPGLALYGGVPRAELDKHIKQVAYPEAAIIQTRTISAGDAVGYNGEYVATASQRIATVSLGYADGFLRARGRGGYLLSEERALPILGKVSMDMIVVDLTSAPELTEGDWLTVPFNLPDAAQQSSVSQYELLTTLGKRFNT